MKILIAGLGSIGRRHLRNLLALGERDLLLYRTHRSTLPDADLAGIPVETDLQAALARRPDAVIVSNPTALHLDTAIPAAQAGCHLFLEKPVSHSLDQLDELEAAVRRGGGQVYTGFQLRFHPGLQQVKRLLEAGEAGRPLSVRAHWGEYLPGWHPWEDYRQGYSARADLGGGVILTLCHPLDYLRWLLGEVDALWAFAAHLSDLDLEVEDTAEIGLRFSSALASLHLDYNQRPPAHRLEIVGSQGTIRWDSADGGVQVYRVPTGEWQAYPAPQGFERNDLFLAQMRHFLAVCRGEAAPLCTLQDGRRALELALAAHESQRTGRLVQWS
ncbi:MAG TPA: Gfo/Idh/MocA family oxidoreductase [Anaerolineales bacterium]